MQHRNIPSTEAHEPKGIEAADVGSVYVSQGDGSGIWSPRVEGAITWSNTWIPDKEYSSNTMVRDGVWTMIANKNTYDKPAPVEVGVQEEGLPVDPTFVESSHTAIIVSGNKYVFSKSGWIQEVRIKVPAVSNDINYKLYNITIDSSGNVITSEIPLPSLTASVWTTVAIGSTLINAGKEIALLLQSINSGSSTVVTGGWTFTGNDNNNEPLVSSWNHNNANNSVRIHKTDLDTTNRTSELLGVVIGSTIVVHDTATPANVYSYTVTSVTEGTASVNYGVILDSQGGGGPTDGETTTITITIPVASATEVSAHVNYVVTHQPTFATVSGYLAVDGVSDGTEVNDAFSVDLLFQEGSLSPDWDIVALSS